jgi:SM-20-related protein
MLSPLFFRALGLFVRPNFLDPAECRELTDVIRTSPAADATILYAQTEDHRAVDERLRRTRRVRVTEELESRMSEKIRTLMPELSDHFQVTLSNIQPPEFLIYRPGDFFTLHRDRDDEGRNQRVASVIAFLNSGDAEFAGGILRFHADISGKLQPLDLVPQQGLLVGFRADTLHEVQPVTRGERYSVVSWFV